MTESPPPPKPFSAYVGSHKSLSEVIKEVPPAELYLILERFVDTVMSGKIASIQEEGRSFTRDVIRPDGQRVKVRIEDEMLIYNDTVAEWIAEQRRETRYLRMQQSDVKISTTRERLESGEDDFERLLEIRRQRRKGPPTKTRKVKTPRL